MIIRPKIRSSACATVTGGPQRSITHQSRGWLKDSNHKDEYTGGCTRKAPTSTRERDPRSRYAALLCSPALPRSSPVRYIPRQEHIRSLEAMQLASSAASA
jgi:hypothetical protein